MANGLNAVLASVAGVCAVEIAEGGGWASPARCSSVSGERKKAATSARGGRSTEAKKRRKAKKRKSRGGAPPVLELEDGEAADSGAAGDPPKRGLGG